MPTYHITAEITVTDSGATIEADDADEALAEAYAQLGDPDDWEFHISDGSVTLTVEALVEATR